MKRFFNGTQIGNNDEIGHTGLNGPTNGWERQKVNGRNIVQLLPTCFQSVFILSIIKPAVGIKARTLDLQTRAIIGLGFLIFFLPGDTPLHNHNWNSNW